MDEEEYWLDEDDKLLDDEEVDLELDDEDELYIDYGEDARYEEDV